MNPPPAQDQLLQIWVLAAVLGLIPAVIAHRKGRSFGLWWIYGAMLFIVALLHSLLIKPAKKPAAQVPAPLPPVATPEPEPVEPPLPEGTKHCRFCGQLIDINSLRCPVCKAEQPPPAV